jgi:glycerol-3-phosphate cytidylyltransferase
MRYCFDIDGTICDTPNDENGKPDYYNATPIPFMVQRINELYDEGHYIILMTARGRGSGVDRSDITEQQLRDWHVKYHELEPMFHKPNADIFIDDKGIDVEEWKKSQPPKRGIVAGAFDLIHPGYIRMFEECKKHCNHLTVALHEDPTWGRPWKMKPIQSLADRKEILRAIKYIDDIVVYQSEETFHWYLESGEYNLRFLGDDYADGSYTGVGIGIPIVFINRDHGYSTTKLKGQIYTSYLEKI